MQIYNWIFFPPHSDFFFFHFALIVDLGNIWVYEYSQSAHNAEDAA